MIKNVLKENWKFLLFVLVASLIGGYCTGLYVYDTLSPDMLNRLQEQNVSKSAGNFYIATVWRCVWGNTCIYRIDYLQESQSVERI